MTGALWYSFRNADKPMKVIIEPWLDEVELGVRSTLEITIYYNELKQLETYLTPGYFTIYLWEGCRARLSIDGVDRTPPTLHDPSPM